MVKPTHKSMQNHISLLDMTPSQARSFLLKPDSYCSIDLPPYFRFTKLINNVEKQLKLNPQSLTFFRSASKKEEVNHHIYNNKDGKYEWRPFQLINPAIYIELVNTVTDKANWKTIKRRFKDFQSNPKIACLSIPIKSMTKQKDKAQQISHWWHSVEQKSIELALDYEYLFNADIADCYGQIYTHSIAWALHGKQPAKNKQRDYSLVGNTIDCLIQSMSYGQTNGIPQGSVLMDFVSEIVLGYADLLLTEEIDKNNIQDYCVIRYRDDYRIFVNDSHIGEKVLKILTEVLITLGLKLNARKTGVAGSVVSGSIKPDKLDWIIKKQAEKDLQKHLLLIYDHSVKHQNSGTVATELTEYYRSRIEKATKMNNPLALISIAVEVALENPRTYPICAAIIGKCLSLIEDIEERTAIVTKIVRKFELIPNTGLMQIWLQRICINWSKEMVYHEPLCLLVQGKAVSIWNCDWISINAIKQAISGTKIYYADIAKKLQPVVTTKEIELFSKYVDFYK